MTGSTYRRGFAKGAVAVLASLMMIEASVAAESCAASAARIDAVDPLIKGEIAAMQTGMHPVDMTGLAFKKEDGSATSLADFSGKTLLVNIWATWCAPCRYEMPDLDKLQAELGGDDFEVVTISLDRKAPDKPRAFFEEIGVKTLPLYYDETMKLFPDLRRQGMAFGMPTTLLIDKDGCSLGHLSGPAAWASEQAKMMVRAAMDSE